MGKKQRSKEVRREKRKQSKKKTIYSSNGVWLQ